jgi:hypothetical protein
MSRTRFAKLLLSLSGRMILINGPGKKIAKPFIVGFAICSLYSWLQISQASDQMQAYRSVRVDLFAFYFTL